MSFVLAMAVLAVLPVYAVVQVGALLLWRGWSRRLALVPVLGMAVLLAGYLAGLSVGTHLASAYLVLAAPPALLWLWFVGLLRR